MYKAARGIASGITEQDTNIGAAISGAESLIQAETGRALASATHTEYFDTRPGQTILHLSHFPVTTFTSLSWRSGSTWTAYSASAYYAPLDEGSGTVQFLGGDYPYGAYGVLSGHPTGLRGKVRRGLPAGPKAIRAIYVAGYASDSLAVSLREPFYAVVDWVRENWGSVKSAQQDGTSGVVRVNRAAADERERLQDLMRPFQQVIR